MPQLRAPTGKDPDRDPFVEKARLRAPVSCQILGGRFHFESSSPELLQLVRWAFAGVPAHQLAARPQHFVIRLVLNEGGSTGTGGQPPALTLMSGGGLLGGVAGTGSFVTIAPDQRSALVMVAQQMLNHPYHIRYELIEFAVFMLAARAQRLIPLHGACVGLDQRGILIMGASGTGKSTLSLHCLERQLDFVAEDAVFVEPSNLLATGVANFVHICPDALKSLPQPRAAVLRASPTISRRSGRRKLEVDVRTRRYRLAAQPQRLKAVVFLTRRPGGKRLLHRLSASDVRRRMVAEQPYAAAQAEWGSFLSRMPALDGYELRRGAHPHSGAEAIHDLLTSGG